MSWENYIHAVLQNLFQHEHIRRLQDLYKDFMKQENMLFQTNI